MSCRCAFLSIYFLHIFIYLRGHKYLDDLPLARFARIGVGRAYRRIGAKQSFGVTAYRRIPRFRRNGVTAQGHL